MFKNDESKLLKKGIKIKLTKVHRSSIAKIGDVYEVIESYYPVFKTKEPIICFVNKNGNESRLQKGKDWNFKVLD